MYIITTDHTCLDIIVNVVLYGVFLYLVYLIGWHIKYKKVKGDIELDKGIVTDMDYIPSKTNAYFNGKSVTTNTTPEKNITYCSFNKIGEREINHSKLYQTVRIDDEINCEYRNIYRVERQVPS